MKYKFFDKTTRPLDIWFALVLPVCLANAYLDGNLVIMAGLLGVAAILWIHRQLVNYRRTVGVSLTEAELKLLNETGSVEIDLADNGKLYLEKGFKVEN